MAVLEALKTNPDLSDIPVVVMSARELDQQETEELKSQIHSVLRKSSFDRAEFNAIIEDILT